MKIGDRIRAVGWAFTDDTRARLIESIADEVERLEKSYVSALADVERRKQAYECLSVLVHHEGKDGADRIDQSWWDEAKRIVGE